MYRLVVIIIGKLSIAGLKLFGSNGSALPGLIADTLAPNLSAAILAQLQSGVVVISGTNGKTTTTKVAVQLLQSTGLKVFTNPTGSNFGRGVTAALLHEVSWSGKLAADIAVLELDEAHAVHFVKRIKPRFSLLLNVMRDQLDRFGEIDHTAQLLQKIASATEKQVILNREDSRVSQLTTKTSAFFGVDASLKPLISNQDSSLTTNRKTTTPALIELVAFNDQRIAKFRINDQEYSSQLQLNGIYNALNIAAALALTLTIKPDASPLQLTKELSNIQPAFGRGETFIVNNQPVEIVLVKNPAGFQLALDTYSSQEYVTMIAVNDNYADGRDMSWLWDVDFSSLQSSGIMIVSGIRAYDMALRLQYNQVTVDQVQTNLSKGLTGLITQHPDKPKRIYCTYTAMLTLHRLIKSQEDNKS